MIPGIDGVPGYPGIAGTPGSDGKDGQKGHAGSRGLRGHKGDRGLPGPRGRPGKNGHDGATGSPGVSLWTLGADEDGDNVLDALLIPPTISGKVSEENKKISVREGDHLKLTCAATGVPKPLISWSRSDGNAYPDGAWRSQWQKFN